MNFKENLKNEMNYTYTENGALTYKSTLDEVYDLFALGGAYRNRSNNDIEQLFSQAYYSNKELAMKCLFYLRDITRGQGERRFFRVCLRWLAENDPEHLIPNLQYIPEFGRWDDLFILLDTSVGNGAWNVIEKQLKADLTAEHPSLLAKWMPSINTSSYETVKMANIIRKYLGVTPRQYRKMLSSLRKRLKVLERDMSANQWHEIEFDKIPSKAGLKYRNAFIRHDKDRIAHNVPTYADFISNKNTKVNAKTLYPYEVVNKAMHSYCWSKTEKQVINKYWDNLTDYIKNAKFNGLAVVDVSGSMSGRPMEVAISLGMYCAEKIQGTFHNTFMTFSAHPQLIELNPNLDFVDKVRQMENSDWGYNTNIEKVFDLVLNTAIRNKTPQNEMPENIIIISDMEFDTASGNVSRNTLFETIQKKYENFGYKLPKLVFWNVDARQNNIPMRTSGNVTFISGFSPVLYSSLLAGKTGKELMLDKILGQRYSKIN